MAARFYVSLPQDLVEDILSRLPVKSLIRFKCVSKACHALITSSQFTKSHFQRASSQNPKVLVLIHHGKSLFDVVQSEALVLSQNHVGHGHNGGFEFKEVDVGFSLSNTYGYLVWNPSTRSNRNIPRSTTFDSKLYGNCYSFGFGYDYSTDDYKLLRSYYYKSEIPMLEFEIFSLKTFTWRKINLDKDDNIAISIRSKVPMKSYNTYFNGAIYWVVEPKLILMKPSIIYFDLVEEIFHEVPFPEPVSYLTKQTYSTSLWELGILGEHLYLSECIGQDFNNFSIQIWVMKESWTCTRFATIPYCNTCLRPIFVSNNNSEILMLDTNDCDGVIGVELIMYNLKENTNTTIFKPKPAFGSAPDPVIEVATYMESLYSLDCN
uniref:F-box domain-containing protein n=1 Tax=Fagus sylvatica TaxID=28930 RepID=A0A2N9HBI5_FAGSY